MTVEIPSSLEELLRRYAAEHGVDVGALVSAAVREFLAQRANGDGVVQSDLYPLRGSVLRYDRPFEPAIPESEWGAQG